MKKAYFAILFYLVSGSLNAQDVKIVGTITQAVKVPDTTITRNTIRNSIASVAKFKLLKVELSDHARQDLAAKAKTALSHSNPFTIRAEISATPSKVELGMNNVPVLNQGMHGTCVTFAVTAALDAALNQGDYISQLCPLQLGNYLRKHSYFPGGWKGASGRFILSQLDVFGIVSKEQEQLQGCGGLMTYPLNDLADTKGEMSIEDYRQLSEDLNEKILWSPILDIYQGILDRVDTNKTIKEVKTALNAGDRLIFGVLLADFDEGFMGAVGRKQVTGDTWVLTPEIARNILFKQELGEQDFGAHEMVITGYDDNAIAIDEQGYKHRGLFTLRNSWGPNVGDQGNFYMSYDYFRLLVLEVLRIRTLNKTSGLE